MEWIKVSDRVPCNRRKVLVWGKDTVIGREYRRGFLGESRYNFCKKDGGRFDCEFSGHAGLSACVVTHWCEIEGPKED